MRRLKPAPDSWSELPGPSLRAPRLFRPARAEVGRWVSPAVPAPTPRRPDPIGLAFALTWGLLTLPFRLVFGLVGLIGRITGVAIGFALMVLGAALSAGPLAMIGVPVFLIGMVVAMRALG